MATGTIHELHQKIILENVDLNLQEFYSLIRILEKTGFARIIGKAPSAVAGRKAKIYEINIGFALKFNFI